jgi:Type II CAAX prenyl endopeptidase Rce1-like
MWALEHPAAPAPAPMFAATPIALVAGLGVGWLAATSLANAGWLSPAGLKVVTLTATNGGLLAVALAWGSADAGKVLPRGSTTAAIVLIAAGTLGATLNENGAVAFVAAAAWFSTLAARGYLVGLGLASGIAVRPLLLGGVIGLLLGGHLLLSASQTLGHPPHVGAWPAILTRWTYDLGANVISAESFFRGALFNRLQRRWSFGPAAAVSAGGTLLRYLIDPLLPGDIEVLIGAALYLTALGVINCWLVWWSGHLGPALLVSALFFLAYRTLPIE